MDLSLPTWQEWNTLPGRSIRKDSLVGLRREFSDKDIREFWNIEPGYYYKMLATYGLNGGEEQPNDGQAAEEDIVEPEPDVIDVTNEPEPEPRSGRGAQPKHKICSVPGCGKKHAAKGFCASHYAKLSKKKPDNPKEAAPKQHTYRQPVRTVEAEFTVVKDADQIEDPEYAARIAQLAVEANRRIAKRELEEKQRIIDQERQERENPSPTPSRSVDLPFPSLLLKGTPAQLRKQFEGVALLLEGQDENSRFEIQVSAVKA